MASDFLTVVKLVLHVSTVVLEELEFIDSVLFVEGNLNKLQHMYKSTKKFFDKILIKIQNTLSQNYIKANRN